MRLIIKTQDRLITFYWIKIQKESIVGWYAQDYIRKRLNIPDGKHFDSHFTFPKDGNYHFSYKYKNEGHEKYVDVYFDKVDIKTISNGSKQKIVKSRKDFDCENPFMTILLPTEKNQELNNVNNFQFPLVSFTVNSGNVCKVNGETIIEQHDITNEDLVVDVTQLDNVDINTFAIIRLTSSINAFTINNATYKAKQIALPNDRCLELVCHY